ncbi:MAG: hypothetical protein E7Z68_10380, partial [Thermoplasmata archaeon]|nr:hypothetical protein [Thermoplasmata archaeon]
MVKANDAVLTPGEDGKYSFEITEDTTITTTVGDPDVHNITYNNIQQGDVNENPATYTVEDDDIVLKDAARFGYDFLGWYTDEGLTKKVTEIDTSAAEDVVLYASWENSFVKVTVISVTETGGTVTTVVNVPSGTLITVGEDDTLYIGKVTSFAAVKPEDTVEYEYAFLWTIEDTEIPSDGYIVTDETTVIGTFTETKKSYDIRLVADPSDYGAVFLDGKESRILEAVEYGTSIVVSGDKVTVGNHVITAVPAEDESGEWEYSFVEWTVPEAVGPDAEIVAHFEKTKVTFVVTVITESVSGQTSVDVTVPVNTVISVDDSGVLHIGDITSFVPQVYPPSDEYEHVFSWAIDGKEIPADGYAVTGETTVIGTFTAIKRTYAVSIVSEPDGFGSVTLDGETISVLEAVEYGTVIEKVGDRIVLGEIEIVAAPVVDKSGEWEYSFVKWEAPATVGTETTIIAVFAKTSLRYDVSIEVNDAEYGTVSADVVEGAIFGTPIEVLEGGSIKIGDAVVTATPAVDVTGQYTYSFVEWDAPETVGIDTVVTAVFERSVNEYTVTVESTESGRTDTVEVTVPYGTPISVSDDGLTLTLGK